MLSSPELSLRESLDGAIAYVLRKCSGNGKQELKTAQRKEKGKVHTSENSGTVL